LPFRNARGIFGDKRKKPGIRGRLAWLFMQAKWRQERMRCEWAAQQLRRVAEQHEWQERNMNAPLARRCVINIE
jgi:hypothetical protein